MAEKKLTTDQKAERLFRAFLSGDREEIARVWEELDLNVFEVGSIPRRVGALPDKTKAELVVTMEQNPDMMSDKEKGRLLGYIGRVPSTAIEAARKATQAVIKEPEVAAPPPAAPIPRLRPDREAQIADLMGSGIDLPGNTRFFPTFAEEVGTFADQPPEVQQQVVEATQQALDDGVPAGDLFPKGIPQTLVDAGIRTAGEIIAPTPKEDDGGFDLGAWLDDASRAANAGVRQTGAAIWDVIGGPLASAGTALESASDRVNAGLSDLRQRATDMIFGVETPAATPPDPAWELATQIVPDYTPQTLGNAYIQNYIDGLVDAGVPEEQATLQGGAVKRSAGFAEMVALDAFHMKREANAPVPRVIQEAEIADPDAMTAAQSIARYRTGMEGSPEARASAKPGASLRAPLSGPSLSDRTIAAYLQGLQSGGTPAEAATKMATERSAAMTKSLDENSRRTLDIRAGSNFAGVDPRLQDILQIAATNFPLRVEAFSGATGRSSGTRNHPTGRAVDVVIYDEKGNALPNSPADARRKGVDLGPAVRVYEQFAQMAREVQTQKYPELDSKMRWGGYFRQGVSYDLMHIDISGGGMALGSWQAGFTAAGLRGIPGAISIGMADPRYRQPALTMMAYTPITQPGRTSDAAMLELAKFGFTGPNAVKDFQQAMGGRAGPADGIIGPKTLQGIRTAMNDKTFQLRSKLVTSGIPKSQIPGAIARIQNVEPVDTTLMAKAVAGGDYLRKGDRGEAVQQLQKFLNQQGARDASGNPLKEDGVFGTRTKQAVKAYQEQTGSLAADGVVGPRTASTIFLSTLQAREAFDSAPRQAPLVRPDEITVSGAEAVAQQEAQAAAAGQAPVATGPVPTGMEGSPENPSVSIPVYYAAVAQAALERGTTIAGRPAIDGFGQASAVMAGRRAIDAFQGEQQRSRIQTEIDRELVSLGRPDLASAAVPADTKGSAWDEAAKAYVGAGLAAHFPGTRISPEMAAQDSLAITNAQRGYVAAREQQARAQTVDPTIAAVNARTRREAAAASRIADNRAADIAGSVSYDSNAALGPIYRSPAPSYTDPVSYPGTYDPGDVPTSWPDGYDGSPTVTSGYAGSPTGRTGFEGSPEMPSYPDPYAGYSPPDTYTLDDAGRILGGI